MHACRVVLWRLTLSPTVDIAPRHGKNIVSIDWETSLSWLGVMVLLSLRSIGKNVAGAGGTGSRKLQMSAPRSQVSYQLGTALEAVGGTAAAIGVAAASSRWGARLSKTAEKVDAENHKPA
jgi:hypothetical protein